MEPLYKKKIQELLSTEFKLIPEAKGTHLLTGESIKADFLCYPKATAIQKGFKKIWFVIECKAPQSSESVKKCLDGLAQVLSYRDSEFEGIRPEMVFLFPEIQQFVQYDNENKYGNQPKNQSDKSKTLLLRQFLERLNIGEISECSKRRFEMRFASNRLYDPDRGQSQIPMLGRAVRIGLRKLKTHCKPQENPTK
ncbi:hypothetical protein JO972_06485 [Verrucomicrobiaceae bacterium 5K15]|uniref:Uncharacterized protein n=1 Tax=Oceaniferula flava TaxID=2800421 RepID=A0AAE2SA53_9BACT|nr:hypothetical protein [Oceaniferula flavus]MBK1854598.1 hypothetical protein [Oceaniferula flavus]MBM1135904.1 hypothetical protein [Oceaniferula flavus]